MRKKILLFSALGTLVLGVCAGIGISATKKADVFSTRASITPPTDGDAYDAWLNSWSKPNHLYVHYNRGDKNDYNQFCFWMWNDATDTDGTLWCYGGETEKKAVKLNPMSQHWMYEEDIISGESKSVYKDAYGVIADVDLGANLIEGKVKKGDPAKPCSYDDCDDFGFLFPLISSMDGASHWTSDGGKDNDVDDWREEENWRTVNGGKAIHIFFASGQLMNYTYYAGSGIPQVKENPIDKDTTGNYASKTESIPDKYVGKVTPTSTSFKSLGVGYQVFVASFRDSNGDGIGDIRGVINSLDYLNDLGVQVLWLTPIQQCGSYHGYDITDYYAVDKRFGTIDDYRELLFKAHSKGMKVLMDLVLNHTSKNNKWFINSEWGVNSGIPGTETDGTGINWRDVYTWKYATDTIKTAEKFVGDYYDESTGKTIQNVEQIKIPRNYINQTVADNAKSLNGASWFKNGESNYYYYGKFGSDMPELNYENKATRQLVQDVAKYWMSFGLDGYRLDAVKHIYMMDEIVNTDSGDVIVPDVGMKKAYDEQNEQYIYKPYDYSQNLTKNISFWKEFSMELKKVYPDCFLVGENFDGYGKLTAGYYQALDSQFDFASYYHSQDIYTYSAGGSYTSKREEENFEPFRNSGTSNITVKGENLTVPKGGRSDFINGAYTSNHDVLRAINMINNKTKVTGTADEIGNAKMAGALALTNPGLSWIYYGDELGMSSNVDQHINIYGNENCEDTWYRQPFVWQGAEGNKVRPHYVNGKYQFNSDSYDTYNKSILSDGKGVTLNSDNSFSCNNEIYNFYKEVIKIKKLYPAGASVSYADGGHVITLNVTAANAKDLKIFINLGYTNSGWEINLPNGEYTKVAEVGCSGIDNYSDFGSCRYSVVAFRHN